MPRTARSLAIAFAMVSVVASLRATALAEEAQPQAENPQPRLLVLAVDAAPYGVVAELTDPARGDAALFQGFHPPRPLISTFPSTTSLAFGGILEPVGVAPSPGYEARFYDREHDEIQGGGLRSYGKIRFPWRELWDWQLRGLWKKLWGGTWPARKAERLIRPSLEAFAASDDDPFFVYYTTTDLVSHLQGPDALEPFFVRLDAELQRLRGSVDFRAVILSDHGMAGGEPLKNVRRDLLRALRQAGFRRVRSLRHDDDVVLVPFGLVSSAEAFTLPGREADAARAMARAEGIDLCVTAPMPDDQGARRIQVHSRHGRAEITVASNHYRYDVVDGDPLRLAKVVAEHGAELTDEAWLEATADRDLPDPLYRIVRGFDLVQNPGSVLCSCAPGHLFGGAPAYFGVRVSKGRLRWTHGALDRESSNGFVTTDLVDWQPPDRPLRFDEAFELLPRSTEP